VDAETQRYGRRAVFLVLLVAMLAAAAASDSAHSLVAAGVSYGRDVILEHRVIGAAVFVVFSALSAMFVFVSTAVFVPVAISAWGRVPTIAMLWIGWLLGGMFSYVIGRYPGRKILRWFIPRKRAEGLEDRISSTATLPLILLVQLALPSELPGYLLGAARYRFWKYLIALSIGELPFAIGAVYLGDSFMRREYALLLTIGIGGALLSLVAIAALNRQLGSKSS
jgi:uncharacterized membrane protein YdjX (TVP38/TMEM64 family)